MKNRGMFILGAVLIGLGILFFIGSIFHIDIWAMCCPFSLILAGIWLVFRPNLSGVGGPSEVMILGDLKRNGAWQVHDGEYWLGIGSIKLDLTQAQIPEGSTHLHINGFIGEVEIRLPADVGLAVEASGMVASLDYLGRKIENVFSPVDFVSENFATASRKIHVEATAFVVEFKVR